MTGAWSSEEIQECIRLRESGLEWVEVAEKMDRPSDSCRRQYAANKKPESAKSETSERTMVVTGDDAVVHYCTTKAIKTEEEALVAGKVDRKVWHVSGLEITDWTTTLKDDVTGAITQVQNYRVHLKLKRIAKQHILDAIDAIFERFKTHKPTPRSPLRSKGDGCLAVLGLFDAHIGKLSWRRETGEDYDLSISERRFSNAVDDLVERSSHRKISQILIPVGNDFLHVDNSELTTTGGTAMDTDGRLAKVFETAQMAMIRAIERASEVAFTSVIWVPGNHDATTSFFLMKVLEAFFRNDPRVQIDLNNLGKRKYFVWGTNLIGLTHGNIEPRGSLPGIMASEQKEAWAKTTCREFLTGHLHKEGKWISKATDTIDAVTIRILPSLAATDAWHHDKGFVCNRKAAEVLFYHPTEGFIGSEIVNARDNMTPP